MKKTNSKIFAAVASSIMLITSMPITTLNVSAATSIPEGIYWLSPKCAKSSCADVSGGEKLYNNYADDIHLWEYLGNQNQQYYIDFAYENDTEYYYTLKCVLTGELIDTDGTNIYESPDSNSRSQKWRFIKNNSYYVLMNEAYGCVMDVSNASTENGTDIQLYHYFDPDNSAQLWSLNSVKSSATYTVNSSNGINVRSGAGTGYAKVGAAKNKTSFKIEKTSGSWGYTSSIKCTNGYKSGWICLDYCKKSSSSSSSISSSGINLDVPHYLQSDKRWRSNKLGSSNCSIWGYGCTVTSLAMMYSYNNNCTVYPNEIEDKLSFTSAGALYWNGVYKLGFSYTSGGNKAITQNLMKEIHKQLKNGRPVMLGSYNSKGGEHWVVINGYSGNDSYYDASDFTILDPAYGCTNLQQHLNTYDKVKRIVY